MEVFLDLAGAEPCGLSLAAFIDGVLLLGDIKLHVLLLVVAKLLARIEGIARAQRVLHIQREHRLPAHLLHPVLVAPDLKGICDDPVLRDEPENLTVDVLRQNPVVWMKLWWGELPEAAQAQIARPHFRGLRVP